MSSRSTALFQPVSFARESHLHYVEQSSLPGMPGADSPDEGRNRGPTHEETPVIPIAPPTRGMDPPAIHRNPWQRQPQGRQVCLVRLREGAVRPSGGDGWDSTVRDE